jgi:hypothetical protein
MTSVDATQAPDRKDADLFRHDSCERLELQAAQKCRNVEIAFRFGVAFR